LVRFFFFFWSEKMSFSSFSFSWISLSTNWWRFIKLLTPIWLKGFLASPISSSSSLSFLAFYFCSFS
jgi:hypothetical protein